MNEKLQNDELLNSYLDGELDPRQMTEVKRLLANSKEMSERLVELEKVKALVGAVRPAELPAGLSDDIKARLERHALLFDGGDIGSGFESESGTKVLFRRKLISAAAMITLAAVLGAVVVSIIIPKSSIDKFKRFSFPGGAKQSEKIAVDSTQNTQHERAIGAQGTKDILFRGRLELLTADFSEYEKLFEQLIKDAGLEGSLSSHFKDNQGSYYLRCSRERLELLLAGLDKKWDKVVTSTFTVEDITGANVVVVDGINAAQISDIYNQQGGTRQIEAARYYSALNEIHQVLPGTSEEESELPMKSRPMPRPVLTSGEKRAENAKNGLDEQIRLTIVIKEKE